MRSLRLILICVLLGAVTTVGVAWALACFADPLRGAIVRSDFVLSDGCREVYVIATRFGSDRVEWIRSTPPPPRPARSGRLPIPTTLHPTELPERWSPSMRDPWREDAERGTFHALGWPFTAMWFETQRVSRDAVQGSVVITRGISLEPTRTLPTGQVADRVLPLGLYAQEFFANMIVFGVAWFACLAVTPMVVRTLRGDHRIRRGQCPSCGYDMRGSDGVCSECGE